MESEKIQRDQFQFSLLQNAPFPVILSIGYNLEIRNANIAFCNLLKRPVEQLVGKPMPEAVPEIFSEADIKLISSSCFNNGESTKIRSRQIELLHHPSPIRWLDINCEPLRNDAEVIGVIFFVTDVTPEKVLTSSHINENKTAPGFIALVNDLTERKVHEEALRETHERLRLVTDAINAGTFDYDIEKEVIHWSPQLRRLLGVGDDEVVTQELSRQIVHPEDRQLVLPKVDSTRNNAESDRVVVDYRIIRKDTGEIRWMHTRTKTFYRTINGETQAVRILGFTIDVSESKIREEQLRRLSAELEQQVDIRTKELSLTNAVLAEAQKVAKLGSWEWDIVTDQVTWSDEMFNIYGYKERFAVNFSLATERMTPSDADFSKRRTHALVKDTQEIFKKTGERTFETPPIEFKITLPDGEKKVLRNSGKIYLSSTGKLEKILGAVQDVTDIRSTEEKLQVAIEKLEERNRDLEAFSYVASHDLKEPLRKILTFASRLNQQDHGMESDYILKIETAAIRMMDLINSVLTLSQLSNSDTSLTTVDLNSVLDSCKSDLEVRIRETGAIITAPNLGRVTANLSQMTQLFSNLIGNSLKFCETIPLITISSELVDRSELPFKSNHPNQQYLCLTFTDNGIGFDKKYKEHVFEPFKRLHGKNTYAGSGIGLSIVKKIIERHKGIIDVDSTPGKGSKFYIFLPTRSTDL